LINSVLSPASKSIDAIASSTLTQSEKSEQLANIIKNVTRETDGLTGKLGELAAATIRSANSIKSEIDLKRDQEKYFDSQLQISSRSNRAAFDGQNAIDSFNGGTNSAQRALDEIKFALENVGSSEAANKAIDKVLSQTVNGFGGANTKEGAEIQREAENLKDILSSFDSIRSADFKFTNNQGADLESLQDKVSSTINDTFLSDLINKKLDDAFNGTQKELNSSNLNEFFNNAFKNSADEILKSSQPFQDALKALATNTKQSVELQARINNEYLNLVSVQKSAIDLQREAASVRESAGGIKAPTALAFALKQLSTESRGRFDLGGGSSRDIAKAGNVASTRFSQIQSSLTSGTNSASQTLNLSNEAAEIQSFTRTLIDTEKARIETINQAIDVQEKKNKLERDSLKDLISGDINEFFKKQAATGVTSAVSTGDARLISSFGGTAIADAITNLENLKDANVREVNGQKIGGANGLIERLSLAGLSARGVTDPREARLLAGTDARSEEFNRQKRESADTLDKLGSNTISQASDTFQRAVDQYGIYTEAFARSFKISAVNTTVVGSPSVPNTPNQVAASSQASGARGPNGLPVGGATQGQSALSVGGFFTDKDRASFDVFLTATQKLADAVDRLSQAEIKVTLAPTTVNVNLNAPDLLKAMGPAVQKMVYENVAEKLLIFAEGLEQGKSPKIAVNNL
jgi:hypothetical protein